MELLDGVALNDFLEDHGPVTVGESVGLMMQMLQSLDEAHQRGIIHRDVKPHNIFLAAVPGERCSVKVLDFGTARAVSGFGHDSETERLTATGMVAGTPQFMAPEQAEGRRDLSSSVDVYAAACVWFQIVGGRPVYTGHTAYEVALKHVTEPIPAMPPAIAGSPLGRVLAENLAKAPEHRHQDAHCFLEAIRGAAAEMAVTPSTPVVVPVDAVPLARSAGDEATTGMVRATRPDWMGRLIVVALLVVVFGLVGLVAWLMAVTT
jgi:serine/threonine-protein kinase